MAAARSVAAPFRVGQKELHLPKFSIALLRTDFLPANNAKFLVPLWFSKLDLRDYLYHVYNVRIHSVRSYVKQQRVRRVGASTQSSGRWHRPRSQKHMTVELERPFVWPKRPEDWSPWNKKEVEARDKEQRRMSERRYAPNSAKSDDESRGVRMREQAKALLEGRERWKPVERKSVPRMLTTTRR